jgi:predicted transposase/invertase (TIGR01784 family)
LLRDKANYDVAEGFLNELTGHPFKITDVLVNKNNQKSRGESEKIDILVEDGEGEIILVEIQFIFEMEYYRRKLFGVSKTNVKQMVKGKQYSKIQKIYSIYIVYFNFGKGEDYVYTGKTTFEGFHNHDILYLSQDHQKVISEIKADDLSPEYYFIRIDKFNDVVADTLDEWIYYLKHNRIKDEFKATQLLKVREILDYMHLSPDDQDDFDYENDIKSHHRSQIATAKDTGRAEGIAIARAEAKLIEEKEKK